MKNYIFIGTIYYGEGIDEPWSEVILEKISASSRAEAVKKANLVVTKKIKEAKKNPSFKSLEASIHNPAFITIRRLKN